MTALREALAAKRVREDVYRVAIADDTEAAAKLAEARQVALLVGAAKSDDDEAVASAKQAVERAQADVDACYYPLRLRGIPPADFEALVAAHPPTDDDEPWNRSTLTPAIVAACAVDSDLTEAEWEAELSSGRWTRADRDTLFIAAMGVNTRAVNSSLGNG